MHNDQHRDKQSSIDHQPPCLPVRRTSRKRPHRRKALGWCPSSDDMWLALIGAIGVGIMVYLAYAMQ